MVDDPNRPEDDNSFDNFPEDNFPGNDFPADDFGGENNSFNDPSFMEEDDFLAADRGIPDDLDTSPPKPNLKEIWDQNPSVKIFAAIAFVAVFLIAYMVFGASSDESDPKNTSMVSQAGEVSQPPGTQELPPAYEEAVRQASEQRAANAANSGGSAIPTPIARPSERIEAPVQVEETDPLSEWRREAEERRNEREQGESPAVESVPLLPENTPPGNNLGGNGVAQQPQNPPLPTGPTPEMVQGISQQLQQQMQTIMETQIPKESIVVSMNIQPGYDMKKYFPEQTPEATAAAAGTNAAAAAAANQPPPVPIISAGTIAYGQILTEANSDVPGPILAEIASGPLLGGRAIGQFSVAQRHLVLQFNRVVKDGIEYPVQVYALDPATTLPGVATDIDRHYFSRVFLPAAARFIEGFASAATQTDNSVVVVDGSVVSNTSDLNTRQELLNGADEAAQQLSSVLEQDFGDRPVTIKVAAGTRVGLLFLSSVFDPNAQQQQYGQQPGSQYQNAANGYVGQAYNAYNAYNNYANGNNNGYANNNGYNNQQYSNGQQQQYYNNTQQNRQQPVSQQQLFSTLRNNR